jgi:protease-4
MFRIQAALLLMAALAFAQEAPKADAKAKAQTKPEEVARIAELELKIGSSEDPHAAMPFGPSPKNFRAYLKLIERAAHDEKLDGVILKPGSYALGMARMFELRDALKALRRNGKKVFVYQESLSTPDLLMASVADRISVPESGTVFLPGLAIESLYMRGLLEKLHLKMEVIHIGDYKTAGESFVRDTMSKELRESLDPILDEYFRSIVKAIAEGRGMTEDAVHEVINQGLFNAKQAKAAGLIDAVEYYDQFRESVRKSFDGKEVKKAGDYKDQDKLKIDPSNPMAAFQLVFGSLFGGKKETKLEGSHIAVIYCTGPITSGKSTYDWSGEVGSMGSETIVKEIDKARKNEHIKAIVLRINSPGGSGLASDMIWRAVERAKAVKPVIASMGDVAASGGYYIAMNSNAIVADPQTITGSIGVVGMNVNMDGFWPWIGINPQRMSCGKRAAAFMTSKSLTEEDRKVLRDYMQEFYGDFVAKVAAGRGKTPAEIEPIARGRIWTGRDALKRGLIDRLGGLEDAIALARRRAGIGEDEKFGVLEYPRRKGPFAIFEEMFGVQLGIEAHVLAKMPALRRLLFDLGVMHTVAQDRICALNPELSGLANPFGAHGR